MCSKGEGVKQGSVKIISYFGMQTLALLEKQKVDLSDGKFKKGTYQKVEAVWISKD